MAQAVHKVGCSRLGRLAAEDPRIMGLCGMDAFTMNDGSRCSASRGIP